MPRVSLECEALDHEGCSGFVVFQATAMSAAIRDCECECHGDVEIDVTPVDLDLTDVALEVPREERETVDA